MFFAKQLYEMTHIDLGYDTDSIVKVHFERYERKQPTTEAEYLKQTSLRKASKENISTAMNASPLFTAWNYSLSPMNISPNLRYFSASSEKPISNNCIAFPLQKKK